MRAVKKMLKKRKAEEAAELERSDSWDLEQPFRSAYYEAFLECERNAGFSDPAFAPVNGETTPTPLNRPWWDCVSPPGSPAYVPPPTADDEFWSTVDFEREVEVGRKQLEQATRAPARTVDGRAMPVSVALRVRDGVVPEGCRGQRSVAMELVYNGRVALMDVEATSAAALQQEVD